MRIHSPSLPALLLFATGLSALSLTPALARDDIMPPPSRAPRTSVESEKLKGGVEAPASMMGTAQAVDGQTIRLHDSARDVTARLIGVVAPPLTTPEGVSARTALDGLLKNQTLDCARRDRDRDGSLVMSCSFGGGRDLSEAILFTGTTLFSRNAAVDNDLAVRYRAAEETAQARRLGLWSQVVSQTPAAAATQAAPAVPSATKPAAVMTNTPTISLATTQAVTQQIARETTEDNNPAESRASESGFSVSAWLQAIGLLGVLFGMLLWLDHRHTRRARLTHELDIHSNRQILAAALTGELAAARDICEARAALITNGGTPTWPRLRTYIYQAHAEQIGLLGAVLARQVASIYGQMADYGASNRGAPYGSESDLTTPASVSRALVRLCGYIEITLEGLAEVEHTGQPYYPTDDSAEERHASQLAQRPDQRPSQSAQTALPQTAKAATQTRVALKRIGRIDSIPLDSGSDGDGGEPAAAPAANPAATQAIATPTAPIAKAVPTAAATAAIETPPTAMATVETTEMSSDAPVITAAETPLETPKIKQTASAVSRAARRSALQQKARAGSLFKAEQAALQSLAETNAAIGGDEDEAADESKSA